MGAARTWEADALAEVDRDWRRSDPVLSGARLVEYTSTSNGSGPGSRPPRSVRLLVIGGHAWDLNARRHRTKNRPRLDVVLDELTDGLAIPEDRHVLDWIVEGLERWGTP